MFPDHLVERFQREMLPVAVVCASKPDGHKQYNDFLRRSLRDLIVSVKREEQDRCAKIAESFWKEKDPKHESEKPSTIAYYISTNIRADRT